MKENNETFQNFKPFDYIQDAIITIKNTTDYTGTYHRLQKAIEEATLVKPQSYIFNEETEKGIASFKKAMYDSGFPPHDYIDTRKMKEIGLHAKNHTLQETSALITEFVEDFFTCEVIQEMKTDWRKMNWLSDRMPILEEAILSHNDSRYYAAISTLLPQLEGIIAERCDGSDYISQNKIKETAKTLLNETSILSFDEHILLFYLSHVLSSFEHGKDIEYPLSRHAILHGADKTYGYKVNSIRCIMLFDYIITRINDYEQSNNR